MAKGRTTPLGNPSSGMYRPDATRGSKTQQYSLDKAMRVLPRISSQLLCLHTYIHTYIEAKTKAVI